MSEQTQEQIQELVLKPYCLKCKSKQEVVNSKIDTTNGRNRLKGECSVCQTKVSCFLKGEEKSAEDLKKQYERRKERQLEQREQKKKDQIRKKEIKEKEKKMKAKLEELFSDDEDIEKKKKRKRKASGSKLEKPKKKKRVVIQLKEESEEAEDEAESEGSADASIEAQEDAEAEALLKEIPISAPAVPASPVEKKKKLNCLKKTIRPC